jgi:hypothetical protein
MVVLNKGFNPAVIKEYRDRINASGREYLIEHSEDNTDEYVNFYFIGAFEGKEVVYDAAIYTLRLHHESELYEIAEHQAAVHFPKFKGIHYREDENGDLMALDDQEEEIGLYMAEIMMNLEDEGDIKVQEHLELDTNVDFGVGLNAAINVDTITPEVISKFIKDYNEDTLQLDDTLYTFQMKDDDN